MWIPGYPNFVHAHTEKVAADYIRRYYRNSIELNSENMNTIRRCAAENETMVVIGISERDKGSLYMAQVFIGPDGNVLLHRRKFKPTAYERVIFGDAVSYHLKQPLESTATHTAQVRRLRQKRRPDSHRPGRRSPML